MLKDRLRPIDIITFIYIIFNLLFILFGWGKIRNPIIHFGAFTFIGIVILGLMITSHKSRFLQFIRDWYPMFVLTYFFEATSAMNLVIFHDFIDGFFQRIDFAIFGYQPARIWGIKFNDFFFQELFHFAYFSYYIMFPFLAFLLYFKHRKAFHHFVFIISFVFYICYITYNFLPVIGGRFWESTLELTKIYRFGIFTTIMAFIYNITTHFGGAFPSSHVAMAVAVTISALRNERWLGYIYVPITILLSISTVYCHYHYFIDTIAGIAYGIGFYYLALKLYRILKEKCLVYPS